MTATIRDPVPGYSDTLVGALGFAVGFMTGILRVVKGEPQSILNCLGVDVVVNSVLALPWYQFKYPDYKQNPIYNCTYDNPKMTLRKHANLKLVKVHRCSFLFSEWLIQNSFQLSRKYPSKLIIWRPFVKLTSSDFFYRIYFFMYHCIPAYFIDALLSLKGSKMSLMKIYKKVHPQLTLVSYFMSRTWKMNNSNLIKLHGIMDKTESFCFDRTIKEDAACLNWAISGLRKYYFKESEKDLDAALRKLKMIDIAHYILLFILYGCSLFILSKIYFAYK